jgi:Ca-activated chloride channel homolog
MHMKNGIVILLLLVSGYVAAQQELRDIQEGNQLYEQGQYDQAAAAYRSALEKNSLSAPGKYNLGNALYQQEEMEESLQQYADVAGNSTDPAVRAKAFHNMGNAYLKGQEYEKSIEAYKRALRENPDDMDTKYNLAYAQSKLKQQQQQQNQDQQDKDQENKDQKDQQQNQDQQNKDQQQKDGQPKEKPYSKEEMERIMQRLNNDDKKVQDKVNKQKTTATPSRSDKDW